MGPWSSPFPMLGYELSAQEYLGLFCDSVIEYLRPDNLQRKTLLSYSSGGWKSRSRSPHLARSFLRDHPITEEDRQESARGYR